MAQFAERFKEHALWSTLQNIGPVLDNALNKKEVDPQTLEMLVRLKSVLAFCGRRLVGADHNLFQPGPLDNINNQFQAMLQEVQQYIANSNAGHLTNANTNADNILTYIAQLNIPTTTEDFAAAKEAAEAYRTGLDKILIEATTSSTKVSSEVDSLRKRIEDLVGEITSEKNRLSAIANDFQTQFSSAQEIRSQTFSSTQQEQLEKFSTLFAEFTTKLGEQNTEFTKQRQEIERSHLTEITKLKKQFVDETTAIRDDVLVRKQEVEKLVGVIGNLGVTSGYLTTANEARTTVRVWQVITVIAMLALITVALVAFLPVIGGNFSWSSLAGRVFISFTVAVLAAYAASQADKYQKIERQNRRLALELEAIGPYIAPLPKEKQEEFRLTVGDRSFGHHEAQPGIDAKSPATLLDLLSKHKEFQSIITEIVKEAVKAAK